MKKEYYQWLKAYKKAKGLKSINEAIYDIIEIHKAWTRKL